ncbi:MAG TPA: 3'-5' exoribonuclease [Kofleriaceae bacterium]|nr:3'-5' exoribonuclease [Kofleriaceae bacterium]
MSHREVYVSVDIEADGPIPGPHSMLSLGAAAFMVEWGEPPRASQLATWSANLETLEGAAGAPSTMEWWRSQPEAWAACRVDPRPPAEAMASFVRWLGALPGRPVFVAYPAGFDFTFVYWYLVRFTGGSPFSHSALDMKTLAMALLGTTFRDTTKRAFPARWRTQARHTHVALDDALEQGEIFCAMLIEARAKARG